MDKKFGSSTFKGEISERSLVLEQINRINMLFSSFAPSPDLVDSKIQFRYDFMSMAQQAKKIALAVLSLEKLVNRHLIPLGFFESEKAMAARKNAYEEKSVPAGNFFYEGKELSSVRQQGVRFLSDNPLIQFRGLEALAEYYGFLLDAIFGMPQFAEATKISIGTNETNPLEADEVVDENESE